MAIFAMDLLRRSGERGVCEGAKCDTDLIRLPAWFPVHGRAASGAKVVRHLAAVRRIIPESVGQPEHRDARFRKERGYPVSTPGSFLAVEAVADGNLRRVPAARHTEPTARTRCNPIHRASRVDSRIVRENRLARIPAARGRVGSSMKRSFQQFGATGRPVKAYNEVECSPPIA
jgi:hypothetical protein